MPPRCHGCDEEGVRGWLCSRTLPLHVNCSSSRAASVFWSLRVLCGLGSPEAFPFMASRNFNFDLIKISHPVLLSSTPNSQEPLPFLCQQTDKNLRDIPEAPSLDPVPCPPLVLLPTASSPGRQSSPTGTNDPPGRYFLSNIVIRSRIL